MATMMRRVCDRIRSRLSITPAEWCRRMYKSAAYSSANEGFNGTSSTAYIQNVRDTFMLLDHEDYDLERARRQSMTIARMDYRHGPWTRELINALAEKAPKMSIGTLRAIAVYLDVPLDHGDDL